MKLFMVGTLGLVLGGCVIGASTAKPAPPPRQVEAAYRVSIGKSDPPVGAVELGSIEAIHGEGCGSWGQLGTFDGAMFELRNQAALRQADYVMLISTVEPHFAPGCHDNTFKIRGMAYRLPASAAASPPSVPPSSSSPLPPPAPLQPAPLQPAPLQPGALQPSSSPGIAGCYPPCSPGYRCEAQTCIALCNPSCGAGQVCRQDRTCAPAPAAAAPPTR